MHAHAKDDAQGDTSYPESEGKNTTENNTHMTKDQARARLRQALRQLSAMLPAQEAQQLAERLAVSGALAEFGTSSMLPQRDYSLAEVKMYRVDPEKIVTSEDSPLELIRASLSGLLIAGGIAIEQIMHLNTAEMLAAALVLTGGVAYDQLATGGGASNLVVDTLGHKFLKEFDERVATHEAGHFITAYLLGVLPAEYTLTALDSFQKNKDFKIQAGTVFCDQAFASAFESGILPGALLDKLACIALAGAAAEVLRYGSSQGAASDIVQLEALLQLTGIPRKKAQSLLRWAVIQTTVMLRGRSGLVEKVAKGMQQKATVPELISIIEEHDIDNADMADRVNRTPPMPLAHQMLKSKAMEKKLLTNATSVDFAQDGSDFSSELSVSLGEGYKPFWLQLRPTLQLNSSKVCCVQVELPAGIVLEESDSIPGRIVVESITEAGTAWKAGIRQGDIIRAVSAQQEMPVSQDEGIEPRIGPGKIKRAVFVCDGQPIGEVLKAVATNAVPRSRKPSAAFVVERKQ